MLIKSFGKINTQAMTHSMKKKTNLLKEETSCRGRNGCRRDISSYSNSHSEKEDSPSKMIESNLKQGQHFSNMHRTLPQNSNEEWWRLLTFAGYPRTAECSAILLARQGFIYCGKGDLVNQDHTILCVFCFTRLRILNKDVDIGDMHCRANPKCPFLQGLECQNKPIPEHGKGKFEEIFAQFHHRKVKSSPTPQCSNQAVNSVHALVPSIVPSLPFNDAQNSTNHSSQPLVSSETHKATEHQNGISQLVTNHALTLSFPLQDRSHIQGRTFDYMVNGVAESLLQGETTNNTTTLESSLSPHGTRETSSSPHFAIESSSSPCTTTMESSSSPQPSSLESSSSPQTSMESSSSFHTNTLESSSPPHNSSLSIPSLANERGNEHSTLSPPRNSTSPSNQPQNTNFQSLERTQGEGINNSSSVPSEIPAQADCISDQNCQDEGVQSDHLSYDRLGIIVSRPKRPEFALEVNRLESFQGWPSDHHIQPEDLAKAGCFFTGYGDCARCFHCGGGLRNWEIGDNIWVEHARWFQNCAFMRQSMGQNFIDIVQHLNKEQEMISFDDVMTEMQSRGLEISLPKGMEDNLLDIRRDPAVAILIDNGFSENDVVKAAQNVKETDQSLGADLIYKELLKQGIKRQSHVPKCTDDSTSVSQRNVKERDRETIEDIKDKISEMRQLSLCKICLDKEVSVLFLPCCHLVSCNSCSFALKSCPFCRENIKGVVRAFLN